MRRKLSIADYRRVGNDFVLVIPEPNRLPFLEFSNLVGAAHHNLGEVRDALLVYEATHPSNEP